MGFGAMIKHSIVPTVLNVILGSVAAAILLVPVVNFLYICAGPLGYILSAIIFMWAGHRLVKNGDGGLGSAAGAGFISGLASSIIVSIINAVAIAASGGLSGVAGGSGSAAVAGAVAGGGFGLVGGILGIIVWPIAGAVFALLGGFIAGPQKK